MPGMPISIDLSLLDLDPENPRLWKQSRGGNALEALVKSDPDKLVELIEDIADAGLNPAEALMVMKTEAGRYIVLEGNRRLGSLIALATPGSVEAWLTPNLQRRVVAARNRSKPVPSKLPCTLFSSRKEAHPWILRKHGVDLGGAGVVSWSPRERREYAMAHGEDDPTLQVYHFVRDSGTLAPALAKQLPDIRLTNLERFIDHKDIRPCIGIDVQNKRVLTFLHREDVAWRLGCLVAFVLRPDVTVSWIKRKSDRDSVLKQMGLSPVARKQRLPLVPLADAPTASESTDTPDEHGTDVGKDADGRQTPGRQGADAGQDAPGGTARDARLGAPDEEGPEAGQDAPGGQAREAGHDAPAGKAHDAGQDAPGGQAHEAGQYAPGGQAHEAGQNAPDEEGADAGQDASGEQAREAGQVARQSGPSTPRSKMDSSDAGERASGESKAASNRQNTPSLDESASGAGPSQRSPSSDRQHAQSASVGVETRTRPAEVAARVTRERTKKTRRRSAPRIRASLIPRGLNLDISELRVEKIVGELKTLKVKDYANAVAVLYRLVLELSVDAYLRRHGLGHMGKLKEKGERAAKHLMEVGLIDAKQRIVADKIYQSEKKTPGSVDVLHQYVHGLDCHPIPSELLTAWDSIQFFVEALWTPQED